MNKTNSKRTNTIEQIKQLIHNIFFSGCFKNGNFSNTQVLGTLFDACVVWMLLYISVMDVEPSNTCYGELEKH